MTKGSRPMLLAALALVLAVCVQSQGIISSVVDAKVDAAKTVHNATKSAIDTKVNAHKALGEAALDAIESAKNKTMDAVASAIQDTVQAAKAVHNSTLSALGSGIKAHQAVKQSVVSALTPTSSSSPAGPLGQAAAARFVANHPVLGAAVAPLVRSSSGPDAGRK
ncbi:hypothetical protein V8C86DRAFT_2625457 [Haematococcus lacustris]